MYWIGGSAGIDSRLPGNSCILREQSSSLAKNRLSSILDNNRVREMWKAEQGDGRVYGSVSDAGYLDKDSTSISSSERIHNFSRVDH